MRRCLVTSLYALTLALVPSGVFAQDAPAAAPAQPTAPKVAFSTPAGALLFTIKADQTGAFEELVKKLRAGLAKSEDATLKQQAPGLKVYKATEPAVGGNVLYVLIVEPTVPNAEYDLFTILSKTMSDEEKRAPETAEMWKRFSGAFASGVSRLSLTPVQ
jgi:hypothetical protein